MFSFLSRVLVMYEWSEVSHYFFWAIPKAVYWLAETVFSEIGIF
jgi:hypothetical protein